MKKRMFLSTILMTLVLLVALTTATFAWYSATSGTANFASASEGIATEATKVTLDGVTFTASFTDIADEKVVLTDNNGKTGYMAGANAVTGVDVPGNQLAYGQVVVKVTASVTGSGDLTEALAALYASGVTTVKLSISSTGKVRLAESTEAVHAVEAETAVIEFTLSLAQNGSKFEWTDYTVYYSVIGTNNIETAATFAGEKITASVQ